MPIVRFHQLPSGTLTGDDIIPFMDNPGPSGVTKHVSFGDMYDVVRAKVTSRQVGVTGVLPFDASAIDILDFVASGNVTLENPTNLTDGQIVFWKSRQDAVGNREVTLDTMFNIPTSATDPLPWSTGVNIMDLLVAQYDSEKNKLEVVVFVPGYAY